MTVQLVSTWRCLQCPEHGEGTPADCDSAARRHTENAPHHGTVTGIRPARAAA